MYGIVNLRPDGVSENYVMEWLICPDWLRVRNEAGFKLVNKTKRGSIITQEYCAPTHRTAERIRVKIPSHRHKKGLTKQGPVYFDS